MSKLVIDSTWVFFSAKSSWDFWRKYWI